MYLSSAFTWRKSQRNQKKKKWGNDGAPRYNDIPFLTLGYKNYAPRYFEGISSFPDGVISSENKNNNRIVAKLTHAIIIVAESICLAFNRWLFFVKSKSQKSNSIMKIWRHFIVWGSGEMYLICEYIYCLSINSLPSHFLVGRHLSSLLSPSVTLYGNYMTLST
jgi:hypothetical protein